MDNSNFQVLLSLINVVHITTLTIVACSIDVDRLTDLINHLPVLDALSVASILFTNSSTEQIDVKPSKSNINKITKVRLKRMTELKDVEFLLQLCPMIEYFEIDHVPSNDYKLFVRFILTQTTINTPYLHTIGICIQANVEEIMKGLEEMINIEKLTNVISNEIYKFQNLYTMEIIIILVSFSICIIRLCFSKLFIFIILFFLITENVTI